MSVVKRGREVEDTENVMEVMGEHATVSSCLNTWTVIMMILSIPYLTNKLL